MGNKTSPSDNSDVSQHSCGVKLHNEGDRGGVLHSLRGDCGAFNILTCRRTLPRYIHSGIL